MREIPYTGVIWVVREAMKLGFKSGHTDWCTLWRGHTVRRRASANAPGSPTRCAHRPRP